MKMHPVPGGSTATVANVTAFAETPEGHAPYMNAQFPEAFNPTTHKPLKFPLPDFAVGNPG